jgi:hypothetical protein
MKANSERAPRVDMSPAAIDRRLRELGQLYELGMSLQRAKRIGKVGESPKATEPPQE